MNNLDQQEQSCKADVSESFLYRDSSYFNEHSEYEFINTFGMIYKGKVNFDKGFWWLNDYYKATSVLCRLVK
jgi:hypothetical protein